MNGQPDIDVCLVTWPNHPSRIEYFKRMLGTLEANLSASRHALRLLCSSEAERDPQSTWHGEELKILCRHKSIPLVWHRPPASLGAGMNHALRQSTAPLILLVQDDFELREPLDLSPGADFLRGHPEVDVLRYAFPIDPAHPQLYTQFAGDIDGWRRVNLHAPWPYGDEPHLRHRDFFDRWGWYVEGQHHGASETDMLWRLVNGRATICAADRSYFGHFGAVAAVPRDREYRDRAVSR